MGGTAMFGNPPPPGGGVTTPPFPQGGSIPSLIGQPAPPGPPIPPNIENLGARPSYTNSIPGAGGQNMFYDPSTGNYDLSSPGGSSASNSVIPGLQPALYAGPSGASTGGPSPGGVNNVFGPIISEGRPYRTSNLPPNALMRLLQGTGNNTALLGK